jgi:ribokinase
MLAALGNDAYAAPIEASLAAAGVVLHAVRVADQATGTAFICVSDDAENAITVAPGANQSLTPAHLTSTGLPPLASFGHLLMPLETPLSTVAAFAHAAHAQGVTVVLNAAPAQALPAELLANVDILIVNEGELAALAGPTGDLDAQLARVAVPTVVVTLGGRGCLARSGQQRLSRPAFAVTPVDTTGAGDTFCGTLVAALSRGLTLAEALRQASAAAALACTKMGAQSSIPTAAEVAEFLAQTNPNPTPTS